MRRSFYGKLTAGCLAVVAAGFAAGLVYVHFGLSARLTRQAEEGLARTARLALRRLASLPAADAAPARLDEIADGIGRALGVRATVLSPAGRPLADSDLAPGGDALRLTLPIEAGPLAGGALRLSMSLREIEETIGGTRSLLLAVGAFALLLAAAAGCVAVVIARRGLSEVRDAVERVSRGDFSRRAASRRRDELGELARAINGLASGMEGRLEGLRRERDRLEAILEGMTEGVMVTDASGDILLANSALRDFFPSLPALGNGSPIPLEAVRSPEVQETVREMLARSAPRAEREVEVLPARALTLHAKRQGAEEDAGLVLVFHDVTEIKRLAGIRQEFTANVSHELRTPLTAIQWASETLQMTARSDPEATRRFASTITRHARRLSALVEDLLELGRIESGEEHVRPESASLRGAVESAARALAPVVEKRGVRLKAEVSAGADRVWADPAALERILINLVENAVNYSAEGGEVAVSGRLREDGFVEVSVADRGEGIPPEHLPRIFERFYRADSARSRESGGTGLGLSIVKHLAQKMGGDVWVESAPGRGSTFRFTTPTP